MSKNNESIKNKILYRASYRGTKEMDILMIGFVKSILNTIHEDSLNILDEFVNLNDETLLSIKKGESELTYKDNVMLDIINKFQKFNL